MGHCSACTGYNFIDYKTYGDIIRDYGEEFNMHGFDYYEYPDSVFFYIEEVTKLDVWSSCHDTTPKEKLVFNEPVFSLSYR